MAYHIVVFGSLKRYKSCSGYTPGWVPLLVLGCTSSYGPHCKFLSSLKSGLALCFELSCLTQINRIFPIHMMTPTWVFPAYPLMLTAPFACNLIAAAEATGRIDVLYAPAVALSAVTTQGTGCLISLMISAAFIYRLMTQKLPRDFQRPGVVSVFRALEADSRS